MTEMNCKAIQRLPGILRQHDLFSGERVRHYQMELLVRQAETALENTLVSRGLCYLCPFIDVLTIEQVLNDEICSACTPEEAVSYIYAMQWVGARRAMNFMQYAGDLTPAQLSECRVINHKALSDTLVVFHGLYADERDRVSILLDVGTRLARGALSLLSIAQAWPGGEPVKAHIAGTMVDLYAGLLSLVIGVETGKKVPGSVRASGAITVPGGQAGPGVKQTENHA